MAGNKKYSYIWSFDLEPKLTFSFKRVIQNQFYQFDFEDRNNLWVVVRKFH